MKKLLVSLFTAFFAICALPSVASAQYYQGNQVVVPGGTSTATTANGGGTIFYPDGNGTYNNGQSQVRGGVLYSPEQTVNVNTSGCQRSLGNALACMAAQTVGQLIVNRGAVREQVAGQQRLARTFQPIQSQPARQPVGNCQRLDGQGTTVWQGEDPGQVCQ